MDEDASLKERYDSFQTPAVNAVASDFRNKPEGRYLLVIPTGGGKTNTAVKAICTIYDQETLASGTDKVLWIAHRIELVSQAKDTFREFKEKVDTKAKLDDVDFVMVGDLPTYITDKSYKLIVIDEAHHSAANSYQPAFNISSLGILGLTATPSRHDGRPLEFEKESFSIGFPDLVKKGIILRPHVIKIEGGHFDIDSLDEEGLELLNNDERNTRIIATLEQNIDRFKKTIVYVGTRTHARKLYELLSLSDLNHHYESISYIDGTQNSRNQTREDFIAQEKTYNRSILLNVQVLTEGYDDPSVNTVVMAAPSKSKLYYMQSIGRAVRKDPNDLAKTAYVVEVDDDLPNIRYRIDNRWLFSDISDALEPAVEDVTYGLSISTSAEEVFTKYNVPQEWRGRFSENPAYRYSMLLFRQYVTDDQFQSYPVLIDNENRSEIRNTFNFLSERMHRFRRNNIAPYQAFRMTGDMGLREDALKRLTFDALINASALIDDESNCSNWQRAGNPWVTFVAFNYQLESLPQELIDFCLDMVNREEILETIRTRDFEPQSLLLKLPLPLASSVGKIVTAGEARLVTEVITDLVDLKKTLGSQDHHEQVTQLLGRSVFPIEHAYAQSLVTIAREELTHLYALD